MTKSELKALVKECLVELLNEGLGGSISPSAQKTGAQGNILKNGSVSSSSVFTEKTKYSSQQPRRSNPQLKEVIRRESGGNKIMESILADTAASTLPKMIENDRPGMNAVVGGGMAEKIVAASDPDEIFGSDTASKWADLAFANSTIKR